MKKVSQEIPQGQKEILIEALNIMESALKTLKSGDVNLEYKLFDILTLKAMLNETELVVNLPFEVYEKFTSINGVDFPNYI
tara:strand:- start:2447 stop:2689 length:243 start_codon:yes stop_codon:yes gene_type:complete